MSTWTSTVYPIHATSVDAIPASTIQYVPVEFPFTVTEVMRDGKRWYAANNLFYPSITTLLSATDTEGAHALRAWRQSIGHAADQHITQEASSRGVRWHTFCEQFVMGQTPHWSVFAEPTDGAYAVQLGGLLNTQIESVLASETRVASQTYGVAGRLDLCVRLRDGREAILDFKTGKKQKYGNRLINYALQTTFYADALTEHVPSCKIDTIVIAQLLPDRIIWQESTPDLWRESLQNRIADYATLINTQLG